MEKNKCDKALWFKTFLNLRQKCSYRLHRIMYTRDSMISISFTEPILAEKTEQLKGWGKNEIFLPHEQIFGYFKCLCFMIQDMHLWCLCKEILLESNNGGILLCACGLWSFLRTQLSQSRKDGKSSNISGFYPFSSSPVLQCMMALGKATY